MNKTNIINKERKLKKGGEMKPIYPMGAADAADEWLLKKIWLSPDWIAENKYDGGRFQAVIDENGIRFFSRRMIERTGNVPHIIEELKQLNFPLQTIIDGEIIHPTNFNSVISVMNSDPYRAIETQKKTGWVEFKIFDIPVYKGQPNRSILKERKQLLEKYFDKKKFKYVELIKGISNDKQKYFEDTIANGGEGVILKNLNSVYTIGTTECEKTGAWFKVKKLSTYDCVVIGGEEGKGKYVGMLGSLKIAQFREGTLTDIGTVSGMNDKQRREWWDLINKNKERAMIINGKRYIQMKKEAYFIIEIEAMERAINAYRFPRFVRIRTDKKLEECKW